MGDVRGANYLAPLPRRRLFAAAHESAGGPTATLNKVTVESAHGGKADVSATFYDVAI
jgi:hypothetical protein